MPNSKTAGQKLPSWDLTDLYESMDSPEIKKDLIRFDRLTKKFRANYWGKITLLKEKKFLKLFEDLETLERTSGRLLSFAYLLHCQETTCQKRTKFLSDVQEKVTEFNSRVLFLPLEINQISKKHYRKIVAKKSNVRRYRIFFEKTRAMKPYQLTEDLENLLNEYGVTTRNAWCKLFDETISEINIEMAGQKYCLEEALSLFQSPNSRIREHTGTQLAKKFKENLRIFGRVMNSLAKEKQIEDHWRKFNTPAESRHLLNDIDPKVITNLRDTVVDSYSETSHRYYRLKAKLMGKKKLKLWDRNAPLKRRNEPLISWDTAKNLVLESYADFHPKMADIGRDFFDNGWIDATIVAGKSPGAFSHPTVTNVHPYILLNYLGKTRDVMTLSHELGHGIHQVLAAKQGEILSVTPLTLAETASVFGEMLTFDRILKDEKNPAQRKHLLVGKIEDVINTVVRQISFYEFECRIHDQRKKGELTTDSISKIWMDISRESLGDSFEYNESYKYFWSYVPHFVHSPFYVYAYAFGDGLVNSLYSAYQSGMTGFEDKYLEMLSSGGSKSHNCLLRPFNLNISNLNFWKRGICVLKGLIDELECLS